MQVTSVVDMKRIAAKEMPTRHRRILFCLTSDEVNLQPGIPPGLSFPGTLDDRIAMLLYPGSIGMRRPGETLRHRREYAGLHDVSAEYTADGTPPEEYFKTRRNRSLFSLPVMDVY